MAERVPLPDWGAVTEHVRQFGEPGRVERDDEVAVASFDGGPFAVERDGHVETGMALHGFEADAADALTFDHEAGAVRVESGGVRYEFRRPD